MALTADQKKETDRLPTSYFKSPEGSDMTDAEYKAMAMAKLEKLEVPNLRARVNVTGVSWGKDIVVNYSKENDYTPAEKQAIKDGLQEGKGWNGQMADITTGGPSLEQRVKKLEGK